MDNTKKNFAKITRIKKKIVCCFLCFFVVLFSSFFSYAGEVFVVDGPITAIVIDNFPFSYSFPTDVVSVDTGYRGVVKQSLPVFTGLHLVCNQSSFQNKLIHCSFRVNLNIAGSGPITSSYPAGSTFAHVLRSFSSIGDDFSVQVTVSPSSSNVYLVLYDCWFIAHSDSNFSRLRLDCGVEDDFTCTWTSSSFPSAIAQFVSSGYSYSPYDFSYVVIDNSETNILNAISSYLRTLSSQASVNNDSLQQLISLTTSTNNMLSIINSQFGVQTNSINNKLDMESQEIQEALKNLESSLLASLNTINNILILINNGITKLDTDLIDFFQDFHKSFSYFMSGMTGTTGYDSWQNSLSNTVKNIQNNWASIIEKGLDKVAPDTGALDTDMSNASSSLDSIQKGDLISGITGSTNQDNAKTAFDTASSFFSSFGTKILYFNNRLMDIYNSLGDFRYVIIMTMVIGLITFIFRVGNTFMRSCSGGGKDINLPNKLR